MRIVARSITAADLRYDPTSHTSTTPDGVDVPHVTAILHAVGVAVDYDALSASGPRRAEQIAFRRQLGSAVHADCHAYDDGDLDWATVDPRVDPYVRVAWATCRENLGLVPLTRERQVFHPVLLYTGFLDGIFRCEGKRVLIDLKIGDPEDAGAAFQTAAYEAAYHAEHLDETIDERWAVQLLPERRPIPYVITNYSARLAAWRDMQKFQAFLLTYHEQACRRRRIR